MSFLATTLEYIQNTYRKGAKGKRGRKEKQPAAVSSPLRFVCVFASLRWTLKFIQALCTVTLVAACAPTGEHCVRLPGNGRYCLVAGPWPEYTAEQTSTVALKGKTLRMIARVASGPSGLRFAGLSTLGQTLFQVSWENSTLSAELPPGLDGRLDPALFPALLQIATWPAERIREGLSEGLELIDQTGRRVIRNDADDVLIVSWEGSQLPYSRLRIEAPGAGLVIDSRTLELLEMSQ